MRILLCVLLLLLTAVGCSSLKTENGQLDIERAQGFVEALRLAGFEGTIDCDLNGASELGFVEGVYAKSPGTRLSFRGSINPGSVEDE